MFDDDSVFAAMQAGARGYLLKGAEPEGAPARHPAGQREAIFRPTAARRGWTSSVAHASPPAGADFPDLTGGAKARPGLLALG
jgi:DNA-binding NarL/FixJ family response regulator